MVQKKIINAVKLKDGNIIPKGTVFDVKDFSDTQYIINFNNQEYHLKKIRFENVNKSDNYCKFCKTHNVEALHTNEDGHLKLIIHCNICKNTYEAYNVRI